jgi:hypothetical protein
MLGVILSSWLMGCSPTLATVQTIHISQAQPQQNGGQTLPISAHAIIGDRKIELEVARTQQQQAMGLMYRKSLADNRGMLFIFESPQPMRFWMKNTLIPLDMIFLRDGKVVAIAAAVPPCKTETCPSYGTPLPVDRVIELRGGVAKEIGLKVGDKVKISFLNAE